MSKLRKCQKCGAQLPRAWSFSVCQGGCMPMTNKSVVAELLGLVEKWRKKACDDNRRTGKRVVYGACAEDLETLITQLEAPVEIPARPSIAQQSGKLPDSPVKRDSLNGPETPATPLSPSLR